MRPFNQREVELNCRLCVEMQGATTRLVNVHDTSKNRDFAFDYSFWSHDNFDVEESGYFRYFHPHSGPAPTNTRTKSTSTKPWAQRSWTTHGRASTAACSRTGRRAPASRTR